MSGNKQQKVLIIYAHPDPSGSIANQAMIKAAQQVKNVTIVDLYALYPDFKIDGEAQCELIIQHDILIFQFPLYWYSSPALLKEWQDVVLRYRFAYGENGDALKDKLFLCAVTAGATEQDFSLEGKKGRTLRHLLSPFEQTMQLCKTKIVPPYILYGTQTDDAAQKITLHAASYAKLLIALSDEMLDYAQAQSRDYLNIMSLPLLQKKSS